jgi:DNA-binding Xre family transcriptional regulator
MITLNIYSLCKLRGIKYPLKTLVKAGISQQVAYEYLKGKRKSLVIKHVEILCTLLHCYPNDLFSWLPTETKDDKPKN